MEGYSYGSVTNRDDEDAEEQPMTATESGKTKSDQTRPDASSKQAKGGNDLPASREKTASKVQSTGWSKLGGCQELLL
jgi:hypothetical protein